MSRKSDLKKAIAESEAEIENLERRRGRSQSALLEAFLAHTDPSETDEQYFRDFSALIEMERNHLRRLKQELQEIEGD